MPLRCAVRAALYATVLQPCCTAALHTTLRLEVRPPHGAAVEHRCFSVHRAAVELLKVTKAACRPAPTVARQTVGTAEEQLK
jgi:hypothetical protein